MEMETKLSTSIYLISMKTDTLALVCTLHLLDGDKIAAIFGLFIIGQLCILAGSKSSVSDATAAHKAVIPGNGEVKVAICTSTNYSKQVIRLEVASTPTGVKHLHKKAEQYDIGIYFEANGHGTILFNENFLKVQDASVQQKGWIYFPYLSDLCCGGCIPNGYSAVT